jgi:hypothetical protein
VTPPLRDHDVIANSLALVEPALDDAGIFAGRNVDGLGRRCSSRRLLGARLDRRRLGTRGLRFAVPHWALSRLIVWRRAVLSLAISSLELRLACHSGVVRGNPAGRGTGRCGTGFRARGRRRTRLRRLAVSNELVIAGRARPWRRIRWQAASPMWHMISHIAGKWGAGAERHGKAKQSACGAEPFYSHTDRRVSRPARQRHRARLTILSDRVAGH